MLGFVFTLTLITLVQAAAEAQAFTATCSFGLENFLGFTGDVAIVFDDGTKRAGNKNLKATGKINNNAAMKWGANQAHGVQVRKVTDISNSCRNTGDVFSSWGDAVTDSESNLNINFNIVDDGSGNADEVNVGFRTLVILRNSSSVGLADNAVVACCVITVANVPPKPWPAATPAAPAPVAWNYNWPQDWVPPAGCQYIPASYVEYQKTTTTTTTTTTYYNYATTAPPPPPPPATQYDPYAPPPPPPPKTTTVYYNYPTTAATTKATTAAYCWNCPAPDAYGNWAPSAYYYVPCAPAAPATTLCMNTYNNPHQCPASQSVLALVAALVALLALLL